jgi:hypothetical protein
MSTTTTDVDLDVNSYSFKELCGLFGIKDELNEDIIKEKIDEKITIVSQAQFKGVAYFFILRASKIILCIYRLHSSNIILDLDDTINLNKYIIKIKGVEDYEYLNIDEILEPIYVDFYENNEKKYKKIIPPLPPTPYIGTTPDEYYITNSKNVSLNHKNITNSVDNTFINSVAPGSLNSIKRITQTQNINLNTCFRQNYSKTTSTNFIYIIPSEIKNVISLRLSSIEIPNAWYLISSSIGNNIFTITINGNTYQIIVPDGNYGVQCLITYLNTTYFYQSQTTPDDLKNIQFSINTYVFKSSFTIINQPQLQTYFSRMA